MALTKIGTDGVKDDAVTSGKIPANAVGTSEIANDAVTSTQIADNTIVDGDIADATITLNKLVHGTSSNDGKFLRANNGADPTFETVTGTTINNNADNRVITGSGTANTLEGEATFTHNPSTYDTTIIHNANSPSDLIIQNDSSGTAANARLTIQSGSNANSGAMLQFVTGSDNWSLLTPKTAGALDFNDNGTLAFKMASSGNFDVITGDVTINGSGKGIDFAQGANTGTAANILDEYEEGTWSPTLFTQNGASNATINAAGGFYTKVGRLVHVTFHMDWNGATNHSGYVYFNNLPFTSQASSSGYYQNGVGAVMIHGMPFAGTAPVLLMGGSSTGTNLYFSSNNSGWIPGNNSNTGQIIASLTYNAA